MREQDKYLPIANISRIMKKALPARAQPTLPRSFLVRGICMS